MIPFDKKCLCILDSLSQIEMPPPPNIPPRPSFFSCIGSLLLGQALLDPNPGELEWRPLLLSEKDGPCPSTIHRLQCTHHLSICKASPRALPHFLPALTPTSSCLTSLLLGRALLVTLASDSKERQAYYADQACLCVAGDTRSRDFSHSTI